MTIVLLTFLFVQEKPTRVSSRKRTSTGLLASIKQEPIDEVDVDAMSSKKASSHPVAGSSFSRQPTKRVDDKDSYIKWNVPGQPSKVERFIDLTSLPPPPYWMKMYCEGTLLPRIPTYYQTGDGTTFYFYDYNPKLKASQYHIKLKDITPERILIFVVKTTYVIIIFLKNINYWFLIKG